MIYHVTHSKDWEFAQAKGFYEASSLAKEGFIHASSESQVQGVLDRFYPSEKGLLLLHIEESLLNVPLKYELAPSLNENFPHIYGPLNLEAVVAISNIL